MKTKYLLFNWDDVNDVSDPSDLSDKEFEALASKSGFIFESPDDFQSAFNGELFSTSTHQLRVITPSKEEERIEKASHYLCEDDETSIADQLALIDAQADIDASVMLDKVKGVIVWEKVEWSFTVEDFLFEIEN